MSRSSSREQPDALLRPRRGSHRGRAAISRAALGSLIAVLAVVAIVGGLWALLGSAPADTTSGDDTSAASAAYAVSPSPSPRRATPTAKPTPTPSRTRTPTPTPTSTPTVTPTPTPTASEDAGAGDEQELRGLQVVVLNQTSESGLAATTASRLRAAGWTVAAVGNFRGTVPSTTVYYPDGGLAAAQALAADLAGSQRVKPRFSTLSSSKLTVVLA